MTQGVVPAFTAIMSERYGSGDESPSVSQRSSKFSVRDLSLWYGAKQALFDINLEVPERSVMALIGPSGCGKSTFLSTLNRMIDFVEGVRREGTILLDGVDVNRRDCDLVRLRRRVGTVFQKSNRSEEHTSELQSH